MSDTTGCHSCKDLRDGDCAACAPVPVAFWPPCFVPTREFKIAQLYREGLGPALDMMLDLFVGHGLHKTGEKVEQRWRKLDHEQLLDKTDGHLAHGYSLDDDSGLPHYAHAAMRTLMLLQLAIEDRPET